MDSRTGRRTKPFSTPRMVRMASTAKKYLQEEEERTLSLDLEKKTKLLLLLLLLTQTYNHNTCVSA